MSEDPAHHASPYLPLDIARCPGVGYADRENGAMAWRDDCQRCLRRLAPVPKGRDVPQMQPPAMSVFECEYLIEEEGA